MTEDGQVAGVVSVLDLLLHPQKPLEDLLQEPVVIESELRVHAAMARLRDNHASMAVIHDGNKPIGIVTMKDLVEVLVGELTAW